MSTLLLAVALLDYVEKGCQLRLSLAFELCTCLCCFGGNQDGDEKVENGDFVRCWCQHICGMGGSVVLGRLIDAPV